MTIPDKPLTVTADLSNLTLGELRVFSKKGFDLFDFIQFLIDHTTWSEEEICEITVGEMEQIAVQLGEALKAKAIPLPS